MRIKNVRVWSEDLKLTQPYSISYETIDSVKNVSTRIIDLVLGIDFNLHLFLANIYFIDIYIFIIKFIIGDNVFFILFIILSLQIILILALLFSSR